MNIVKKGVEVKDTQRKGVRPELYIVGTTIKTGRETWKAGN